MEVLDVTLGSIVDWLFSIESVRFVIAFVGFYTIINFIFDWSVRLVSKGIYKNTDEFFNSLDEKCEKQDKSWRKP